MFCSSTIVDEKALVSCHFLLRLLLLMMSVQFWKTHSCDICSNFRAINFRDPLCLSGQSKLEHLISQLHYANFSTLVQCERNHPSLLEIRKNETNFQERTRKVTCHWLPVSPFEGPREPDSQCNFNGRKIHLPNQLSYKPLFTFDAWSYIFS